MDLSSAFNTVDHDLLLHILNEKFYGISGTALKWYKSYLQPGEFIVCINSNYSKSKSWTFPVPQGSGSGDNRFITYCPSSQSVIPLGTSE